MSESFAELFEQSQVEQKMRPGAIVKALVVSVGPDVVVVNAGLKSEGVIPTAQFYNERGELQVKAGDLVEVALDAVEDGYGTTVLSREKAKRAQAWGDLERAFEKAETVTGIITEIGLFYVRVRDDNGDLVTYPANLILQKPVRKLEGKVAEPLQPE